MDGVDQDNDLRERFDLTRHALHGRVQTRRMRPNSQRPGKVGAPIILPSGSQPSNSIPVLRCNGG